MGLRPYPKAGNYPMRKVPSLYQEERNVVTRDVEWQPRNTQADLVHLPSVSPYILATTSQLLLHSTQYGST